LVWVTVKRAGTTKVPLRSFEARTSWLVSALTGEALGYAIELVDEAVAAAWLVVAAQPAAEPTASSNPSTRMV
jgi:hypothetical protein